MKENEVDNVDASRFADAVVTMVHEYGYREKDDRVLVDCDMISGGLTAAEIIYELYNHVANEHNYTTKTLEEIRECLAEEESKCLRSYVMPLNGAITYPLESIGKVAFNCTIAPTEIDLTLFVSRYGSMAELVRGLWKKRIKHLVVCDVNAKKVEPIGG